jgi:hypothetical protein
MEKVVWMNPWERAKKISKAIKRKHKEKEYAKKQKAHLRKESKKLWESEEHRKKMSKKGKERYGKL